MMTREPLFWPTLYALPFLMLVGAVLIYAVDVPTGDALYYAPHLHGLLIKHQFGPEILQVQINEHKPLFPFTLNLLVAALFGWHAKLIMVLNVLIAGVSFLAITRLAYRTLPHIKAPVFQLLILTFSILYFSFVHWGLWTESVTTNLVLANTAAILAITVLAEGSGARRVTGAALLCFIASYSAVHGILAWFAAVPLVNKRFRWLWLGLAALVAATYFINYQKPTWPPDVTYGLRNPHELIIFALIIVGSSVFPDITYLAAAFGVVLAVVLAGITVWLVRNWQDVKSTALPWICLIVFGGLAVGSVAVGRVGFGYYKALTSRYVFFGLLATLPLFALSYIYWVRERLRPKLALVLIGAIGIVGLVMSGMFFRDFRSGYAQYAEGTACLRSYQTAQIHCLSNLGHSLILGEDIKRLAPHLQELGVF